MTDTIKFDSRNYRIHNQRNKDLIKKSLQECGAGRSICIDNDNQIIAGNGIYEQAKELGIKTRIIETDGTELIAIKRTDLAPTDVKRREMAILDNTSSDSAENDIELMKQDIEIPQLQDWGVPVIDDWDSDIEAINKIKAEDGIAPARVVLEFDATFKEEITEMIENYCQEHEIAIEIK